MTRLQLYLTIALAFAGWCNAYPYNQRHYVISPTGNEGDGMLGSKFCTRGPAYWCHNITQAAECHAVKHCIKKVWENPPEKLPADNDSVCKVCLDMVQQARDQLLFNETQVELRQMLEGSCNRIPLKLVSKECRELADDFIPELIDALTSRMDPQMVCHISGLCNSLRINQMLAEMKEIDGPKEVKLLNPLPLLPSDSDSSSLEEDYDGTRPLMKLLPGEHLTRDVERYALKADNEECQFCEYVIHYLETYLDYAQTEEEVRKQVNSLCYNYLPNTYAEQCTMFVNIYGDALVTLIAQRVDFREFCPTLRLC